MNRAGLIPDFSWFFSGSLLFMRSDVTESGAVSFATFPNLLHSSYKHQTFASLKLQIAQHPGNRNPNRTQGRKQTAKEPYKYRPTEPCY